MVDDRLRLHDVEGHLEQDEAARDRPAGDFIIVDKLILVCLERRVVCPRDDVLEDEVHHGGEASKMNLVSVDETGISHSVRVYRLDDLVGQREEH